MAYTLGIPTELRSEIDEFHAEHGLTLVLSEGESGDVIVKAATERLECSAAELYMGGWISCATAWGMAAKLGITKGQAGKLLDLLKVKVRNCELGCF